MSMPTLQDPRPDHRTFECPHLSVGAVSAAACGVCGLLPPVPRVGIRTLNLNLPSPSAEVGGTE